MAKKNRSWYEAMGVQDPTHEPHIKEDQLQEMLGKKVVHEWRQQGSRLHCVACPYEHATEPLFTNYILEGTNANGEPILKKLTN